MKVLIVCSLLVSACATGGDHFDAVGDTAEQSVATGCPTAPAASLTWWRWTTQRHYASVVWSTDGHELLVSELTYEAKRNLFTGYDDARKYCYRLSTFTPVGQKLRDVMSFTPGFVPGDNTSIADMTNAGYMLVHTQDGDVFHVMRVAADGTRKLVTSASCGGPHLVPSPDGQRMALMVLREDCGGASSPQVGSSFTVSFFDGAGNPIGGSATVSFQYWGVGTWTRAGDFVMTDNHTATKIAVDGTTTTVPLPGCLEPATTSSEVAADGRVAGLDAQGNPAVVGSDPARVFGCQ